MNELTLTETKEISGGDAYEAGRELGFIVGYVAGTVTGGAVILTTMFLKGIVKTATGN